MDDYKKLLLEFIASLCLCDHMGDVANDIEYILKKIGIEFEEENDFFHDLLIFLGKKEIVTIYGTKIEIDE